MSKPGTNQPPDRSTRREPEATLPLLVDYATYVLRSNPVWASRRGAHAWDGQLGLTEGGPRADHVADLALFLHDFAQVAPASVDERLDLEVSRLDATQRLRESEAVRPHTRVPYLYPEAIGFALESALTLGITHADRGPEVLLATLADIPRYLTEARRNLDAAQVPPEYAELARSASTGLAGLLGESRGYADTGASAVLVRMCERSQVRALESLEDFRNDLGTLQDKAAGSWRVGRQHYEHLLRDYFLVDSDADQVAEWAREQVARDREALTAQATTMDPSRTWQEQLVRIQRLYPAQQDLFEAHAEATDRARRHTVEHDLVSVPDGESCSVDVVPAHRRPASAIAAVELRAPWDDSLASRLVVTPVPEPTDGTRGHEQPGEHCYAMITALSGQLSYPGQHLQQVHHRLATAGNASIRRVFMSGAFVHGWGLYAEDVMHETGYLDDPDLVLYRLRNSLWRSARVVVDVGLHAGQMSLAQAVEYLVAEAELSSDLAESEVRRCLRHDQACRPTAYAMGRVAFHELRQRWQQVSARPGDLRAFHDDVLRHGSVPLRLISDEVIAAAPRQP